MTLERDLIQIGLAPKEAKVYVVLLELGTASVQAIAQRAGVVRPTAYVVLDHLARKGLISKATGPDAKKMLFMVEEPERLERYVVEQQQEVERRRKDLERLVPELRSAYARGEERPRVRLFEGKEGLRHLQEEFIAAGRGPVVGVGSVDDLYALFPALEYHERIRSLRLRVGVKTRHVYTRAAGPVPGEEDEKNLREGRYMPSDKLPIHGSFYVNGPVLSIVSLREKILGVLIEHSDIADSFRALFEVLWEAAGKYQQRAP